LTSLTTLLAILKCMSRPESPAIKDIDIGDILNHRYGYRIDISKGDIDSPLQYTVLCNVQYSDLSFSKISHFAYINGCSLQVLSMTYYYLFAIRMTKSGSLCNNLLDGDFGN